MKTSACHHSRLSAYLEELFSLCAPRSPSGALLEDFANGVPQAPPSYKNHAEGRLVRLTDMLGRTRLTWPDIQVLAVYFYGVGRVDFDICPTGEVVGQDVLGVDHRKAAKLLGIKGKNPSRDARRAFLRALKRFYAQ